MGALRTAVAASLVLLLTCLGASAPPDVTRPAGRVVLRAADPSFLHGTGGDGIDRVAAAVVVDLRQYWARAFPRHFGAPWRDLDGGYFSVDTTRTSAAAPPCSGGVDDVEGNAYYCPTVDAMAWDRAALLPVLREHYGEGAVTVVLAHEIGHAVQQRAGLDPASPRAEALADCYAGSFLRWVSDGHAHHLRWDAEALDSALRALIVFRDPVGSRAPGNAHGSALARVSAFQAGFESGAPGCSEVTGDRLPTGARQEWRSLTEVRRAPGLRSFFDALAPGTKPPGPSTVDQAVLRSTHRDLGAQAAATVLASRYALTAERIRGHPVRGSSAQSRITCLSGAYTTSGADGPLSPADVDAAVAVLLSTDRVSADSSGTTVLTGYDRVRAFRTGALGGAGACG